MDWFRKYARHFAVVILFAIIVPYGVAIHETKEAEAFLGFGDTVWILGGFSFVADTVTASKEFGVDTAVSVLVEMAVRAISGAVVKWANSGFKGSPNFTTSLRRHMLGQEGEIIQRLLERIQIGEFNGGFFCGPFSEYLVNAFELQLIVHKESEDPPLTNQCTLDHIMGQAGKTLDGFKRDFRQGGWPAWVKLVEEENNVFGAHVMMQREFWKRKEERTNEEKQQLSFGDGFLAHLFEKECIEPLHGPPAPGGEPPCGTYAPRFIATPANTIEKTVEQALGLPLGRLQIADEIGEMLSAVALNLLKLGIMNISKGLFGSTHKAPDEEHSVLDGFLVGASASDQAAQREAVNAARDGTFANDGDLYDMGNAENQRDRGCTLYEAAHEEDCDDGTSIQAESRTQAELEADMVRLYERLLRLQSQGGEVFQQDVIRNDRLRQTVEELEEIRAALENL